MQTPLSASAMKVQKTLDKLGLPLQVLELPNSTRTASDAAHAIGFQVGQIAKSLIFKTKPSGKPVLVIASGGNRVNEKRISQLVGEKISKADADFVRQQTGFVIGGVPPVGYKEALPVFIDEDLLVYDEIWAAAGTPHAVFRLTPDELSLVTRGLVISVK
jgi:prolyl-tRNA editing enzyme YbaK/EbsC (Cys-tRNA(Pro) deacylase)